MPIELNRLAARLIHPETPVVEQVLAVYRQCEDFLSLGPVAHASLEMVQADLALSRQGGGTFMGIYDASRGEMVGVLDFIASGWEGRPETAFIALLMIARPYRGRGFGRQVVEALEQALRQSGQVTAIELGTQANNAAGLAFWQHMGYQIISGPDQQPDQTVTYLLRKALQPPAGEASVRFAGDLTRLFIENMR